MTIPGPQKIAAIPAAFEARALFRFLDSDFQNARVSLSLACSFGSKVSSLAAAMRLDSFFLRERRRVMAARKSCVAQAFFAVPPGVGGEVGPTVRPRARGKDARHNLQEGQVACRWAPHRPTCQAALERRFKWTVSLGGGS